MPIPNFDWDEISDNPQRTELRLVDGIAPSAKRKSYLYPRTIAHCLDLFVVQGFSLYAAKVSTLALLSGHMGEIQNTGKLAGGIFRELFQFGNSQIFFACFSLITLLYFVGMPLICGRTFGLGIFGLKLETDAGNKPDFRSLAIRLGAYVVSWTSLGLIFAVGLRRRDGLFLHDQWSGTKVVKS